MFKVPDLRNKILFVLLIIGLYRFGAFVPTPGIDFQAVQDLEAAAAQGGALGFLQLFSGGALTRFAVFGLGIMPYITASIIMQVLAVVIPKLEQWREQGAVGQKKITQWTRYLTVALAILQSTGLAFLFSTPGAGGLLGDSPIVLIPDRDIGTLSLVILSLTAGTALLMWMGELITQRGIGNGMSLLIFASVVSILPSEATRIFQVNGAIVLSICMAVVLAILASIVFVNEGQRRIPVQFAKRVVGRRQYGGQSSYIPLKVNQSGVIPIIFASSVLYLPVLMTNILPAGSGWDGVRAWIENNLLRQDAIAYIVIFGLMIIFFAYFYTAITFDPVKQADTIRKQGGFIPGIRPGPQTERHLAKILSRITLPGALFIASIALIPSIALAVFGIEAFNGFGGISLLIAVGVALETMKQIDSQLMMRNYESFLK
ncbi:MAG TPA: preprotein translocase subunit SecY [Acidimicrobiales bacterium]|nr:preprotein translocase subunit SecY [Acidimicrobiales bacterium]